MRPVHRLLVFLPVAWLAGAALALAARPAVTVSPGAPDRTAEIATTCPTFSWAATEDAAGYELVVLDLARPEEPRLVLRRAIAGGASAWTPELRDCLPPGGTYAWTLCALDPEGQPLGGKEGWATLRRFTVAALPSAEEVIAALETLRRWQAGRTSAAADGASPPRRDHGTAGKAAAVSGTAAIRGENPATTGLHHGVWGQTGAVEGAAIVAVNVAGGPDLLLDGSLAGSADARLTEKSLDRPSALGQTFSFENSLGGGMALAVNGVAVSLEGHVHSGAAITSGTVADARIASTLARDSEVLPLVLAADGAGSTLDADLLDGLQGASYQRRVTGTCGAGEAVQGVNADGTVTCSELPVPPHLVVVDDPADTVGQYPSLAIGNDGLAVIAYYNSTDGALVVAKCLDPACGAASVVNFDPTDDIGQYASIAVGDDGFPVIAYYNATDTALEVRKCSNAACSSGASAVVDDTAAVGEHCSLAIGNDGLPVISYFDDTSDSLKVAKCDDAACSGGGESLSTVDDHGTNTGMYSSIAIGADGFPVVSYFTGNADLLVAKCNDLACTAGAATLSTIDLGSTQVGYDTAIAIGTDGYPVIAHHGWDKALVVTKCDDPACSGSGETSYFVDRPTIGLNGRYPEIVVGTDGLPIVSYSHTSYGALKVVHCDDPACATGGEVFTYVDSLHTGALSTVQSSLALGADGLPVIAYTIFAEGTLKVAKCLNPSCHP